jgi:hemolysin activation/secretion protein
MKYTYTRYTGDDLEDIDIEELVSKLSRLLLASGFGSPAGDADDPTGASDQRPEQDLHDAMLEALLNGGLLSSDAVSQLLGDAADGDGASKLEQLAQRLIEQMAQQGYITRHPDLDAERRRRA